MSRTIARTSKIAQTSVTLEDKLYEACLRKKYDEAKEILSTYPNIDVNQARGDGKTLLYLLCSKSNVSPSNIELIKLLLQKGANPNKVGSLLTNQTPLHITCDIDVNQTLLIQLLLDYNANPTKEDFYGDSPLYCAIKRGNKRTWNLMLSRGANVNYINKFNDHILHKIFELKDDFFLTTYCVPDLLKYGADVFAKNASGKIPLILALETENLLVSKWFAERMLGVAEEKEEATNFSKLCKLILAILNPEVDQSDVVIDLLKDVDDFHGATLDQLLFLATSTDVQNPKLIREILRHGANVDSKDSKNLTPLFRTLLKSSIKSAEVIMKYKPNLRAMHQDTGSALHFAAKYCTGADEGCFNLMNDLVVNHKMLKLINADIKTFEAPIVIAHRARNFKNCLTLLELEASWKFSDLRPCLLDGLCPIVTHFRKLGIIGYKPIEGSSEHFYIDRHFKSCRLVRNLKNTTDSEYKSFEGEIAALKRENVNELPKTTLFDVLLMDRRKMATYSVNQRLVDIFEDTNYFKKYPFYGQILKQRFLRGSRRKALISPAKSTIDCLLGKCYLNDQCSETILQYLSEEQLKEFTDKDNFFRYTKCNVLVH